MYTTSMHLFTDLLTYGFMIRAVEAGLAVAVIAPLMGSFLVVRRMSFIADALSHVALTGVAIGLLIGINPLLTTIICTVLTALIIEEVRTRSLVSAESILAMILPGGLAMALILISMANGLNANLFSYLFGSITTVTPEDVWIIIGFAGIMIAILLLFYRQLMYTSFDEESAKTSGIPTQHINRLFMVLIALVVSVAMRIVGALLVGALMVIPVVTAMQLSKGFGASVRAAVSISVVSVLVGLAGSYLFNLPAGAAIVVVSLLSFALASLQKK